jgi:hypothetical protein
MSAGLLEVTKITRELTASLEQLKAHEREARVRLEQRCAELEEEKISLRKELVSGSARPATTPQPNPSSPTQDSRNAENEVIALLALLQEKGRFLDFLEQDLVSVSNEQLGVVSRVVHAGCKEVIAKFVTLEPLADRAEGDQIELSSGYDPGSWRLLGHVRDNPPYRGTILHRGWKIVRLSPNSLPERKKGNSVLYPAELQVQAA